MLQLVKTNANQQEFSIFVRPNKCFVSLSAGQSFFLIVSLTLFMQTRKEKKPLVRHKSQFIRRFLCRFPLAISQPFVTVSDYASAFLTESRSSRCVRDSKRANRAQSKARRRLSTGYPADALLFRDFPSDAVLIDRYIRFDRKR